MPRNVRNFWIEVEIDGRHSRVATGPSGKDGGFTARIQMRDAGGIIQALTIHGRSDERGQNHLTVTGPDGQVFALTTER